MSKPRRIRTLRSSPPRKLAGKLDTEHLGCLQFPGETSHDIDGISTSNTNGSHTQTTGIGCVRVSTDKQSTGESVVLEDDLVNDTRAGLPETNVVLCARSGQEVIDFPVDVVGASQILRTANLSLDKMVAVHSGRGSDGRHASRHELQDGHLSGGILAGYAVGAELEVAAAALDFLVVGVVQVGVENLLGEGQRTIETLAHYAQVLAHLLVVDVMALLPVGHFDLARERRIADGGQLPPLDKALADTAKPRELLHGGWFGDGVERWRDGGGRRKERQKLPATWPLTNGEHSSADWLVTGLRG